MKRKLGARANGEQKQSRQKARTTSGKSGSTTDLRKTSGGPAIVFFASRALFCNFLFLFFVFSDLLGFDSGFLVLKEKTRVSDHRKCCTNGQSRVAYLLVFSTVTESSTSDISIGTGKGLTSNRWYCSPPPQTPSHPYPHRYTNAYMRDAYT